MRKIVALSTAVGAVALPATVVVAPLDAASQADQRELELPYCSTYVLSPAEIEAGQTSKVDCYATLAESRLAVGLSASEPTDAELTAVRAAVAAASNVASASTGDRVGTVASSATYDWARHYDYLGSGPMFTVAGPMTGCDSSGLSFAPGDPWDNRISSTKHYLCGKVKHWVDPSFAGGLNITTGIVNQLLGLNVTLNNQASSMRYYAS